jgi:predicted peroxiredoxin
VPFLNILISHRGLAMNKSLSIILIILFYFGNSSAGLTAEAEKRLFVSLTTDNLDRAAMAVGISNKVLSTEKIPVTIFLSAQGVRWADKTIPQNRYANGKTIPEMLKGFMKAGGRVIICKMCMKNVGGMKKEEVLEGIKFSGTLPALFADNTTVLSY